VTGFGTWPVAFSLLHSAVWSNTDVHNFLVTMWIRFCVARLHRALQSCRNLRYRFTGG